MGALSIWHYVVLAAVSGGLLYTCYCLIYKVPDHVYAKWGPRLTQQFSAEGALASIERNCGMFGYSWNN